MKLIHTSIINRAILLLCLLAIFTCAASAEDNTTDVVREVANANLRKYFQETYGFVVQKVTIQGKAPYYGFYDSDLKKLTELDLSKASTPLPISNIEGLQYATNITKLNLKGTSVSYKSLITALSGMLKLQSLDISDKRLTNDRFSDLINVDVIPDSVTTLDISSNNLYDIYKGDDNANKIIFNALNQKLGEGLIYEPQYVVKSINQDNIILREDTVVYVNDNEASPNVWINLDTEKLEWNKDRAKPFTHYSINNGKWVELPSTLSMTKLLNGGGTFRFTDNYDSGKNAPKSEADIYELPLINPRPAMDKIKVDYLSCYDEDYWDTGEWTLSCDAATLQKYQISILNMDKETKKEDPYQELRPNIANENNINFKRQYGEFPDKQAKKGIYVYYPEQVESSNGKIKLKVQKPSYNIRIAPTKTGSTYTPGSKPKKLSVSGALLAPKIRVDYKKEKIYLKQNMVYDNPFDNGESYITVTSKEQAREGVDFVSESGDLTGKSFYYRTLPTDRKPASIINYDTFEFNEDNFFKYVFIHERWYILTPPPFDEEALEKTGKLKEIRFYKGEIDEYSLPEVFEYFVNNKWTKSIPQKEGTYPIRIKSAIKRFREEGETWIYGASNSLPGTIKITTGSWEYTDEKGRTKTISGVKSYFVLPAKTEMIDFLDVCKYEGTVKRGIESDITLTFNIQTTRDLTIENFKYPYKTSSGVLPPKDQVGIDVKTKNNNVSISPATGTKSDLSLTKLDDGNWELKVKQKILVAENSKDEEAEILINFVSWLRQKYPTYFLIQVQIQD